MPMTRLEVLYFRKWLASGRCFFYDDLPADLALSFYLYFVPKISQLRLLMIYSISAILEASVSSSRGCG
jgi:hypothetical protein